MSSLTLIDTEAPNDSPGVRDDTRDTVVDRLLDAVALHVPVPLPIDRSGLRGLDAPPLMAGAHPSAHGLACLTWRIAAWTLPMRLGSCSEPSTGERSG